MALAYSVRFRRWISVRPGLRFGGGCGIERGFEVGDKAVGRCFIGTRQALRRHFAGAHFADYLFPDLGVGGDFGEVAVF